MKFNFLICDFEKQNIDSQNIDCFIKKSPYAKKDWFKVVVRAIYFDKHLNNWEHNNEWHLQKKRINKMTVQRYWKNHHNINNQLMIIK